MSIATEIAYVDGVTAVPAAWLNLIQEHLAGLDNVQVTAAGQVVTIAAAADDSAAGVYINGEQRVNEADIIYTFTGSEATATHDVYIVGDGGGPGFTMEVVVGAPVGTNTRKIAEVDYDTTLDVITALRVEQGRFEEHIHALLDAASQSAHSDLLNPEAGDPHTQYMLPDGSRPYTGVQVGVYPVASSDLVTRLYADDQLTSGVPIGTVIPYAGAVAPTGWFLADGQSFLNATYPVLAAMLNDVYGGDAGTNTNVPDMGGVFALGADGTYALGDTGGALDHIHTQATHQHQETAHTHPMTAHAHTNANAALDGAHGHTQPSTDQEAAVHKHTGPSHLHAVGTLSVGSTGSAIVGAESGTAGLWSQSDLDSSSDNSSHAHGDGSYSVCCSCGVISGTTANATFSHTHSPAGGAQHTHGAGGVSGSTALGGTEDTGDSALHTHANPTTDDSVQHTHTVDATDAVLTVTDANAAPPLTGAGGGDATDAENAAFQAVQYIIKHD